MTPKPITHCYWVEPGKLLAGEYPGTKEEDSSIERIRAMENAGVAAFIDLTEKDELLPYSDLLESASHQRFPIVDVSVPSARETTIATLNAIDHHISEGRTVYVHCWGGVGRTGVIVGCWLARHGHEGPAALERLRVLWTHCPKSARRISPETGAQEQYILDWKEPA